MPQRVAQRSRIVLLALDGIRTREIASILAVSRATVRLWTKRFAERGPEALLHDAPGRGRHPRMTAASMCARLRQANLLGPNDMPVSMRRAARLLGVSATSVWRTLNRRSSWFLPTLGSEIRTTRPSIATTGHVALYGIYFDHDKSDVKPESAPTLAEIAKFLKAEPKLSLYVVGHTDSVGTYDYNMALSARRAAAVVKELTGKHGIAAAPLKPAGTGPLAPVAPNDTEDGRAKNRRVELVKQ
jgi:outer membrane protein OmpA-like peptidoglycan-associated protein